MNDPSPPSSASKTDLLKVRKRRQALLEELDRTYDVPGLPDPELGNRDKVDLFFAYQALRPILLALARASNNNASQEWAEVRSNEHAALIALGAKPSYEGLEQLPRYRHAEAVRSLIVLAGACGGGEKEDRERWVGEAWRVERVCLGGEGVGREFFEGRWREVLRENGVV